MKKYKVVTKNLNEYGYSERGLIKEFEDYLEKLSLEGWQPVGGISRTMGGDNINRDVVNILMVREENEREDEE